MESATKPDRLPIAVSKAIPYSFDLGNLLCIDTNHVPHSPSSTDIYNTSRDCAQALLNQLLSTIPITTNISGVSLNLPPSTTPLPREKILPASRGETKWEAFARKKGIKNKQRGEGKMAYNEEKGEWEPVWGYKGRNKADENDWIVEVDEEKSNRERDGTSVRSEGRKQRVEKVRRNERKRKANERAARKKT